MIKVLLLIFDPIATWDGILRAQRGIVSILLVYLLPLLLLTSAAEAYGLTHWGKWEGDISHRKYFSVAEALIVGAAQVVLSLAVVLVGAKLVKSIGETFHGQHTYTQAFTTVAYSLGPLFLLRFFDAFTGVWPWATWAIGIVLSVAVLYHGVPRMMQPDPSHAFGLYVISSLLLALVTAIVRFVTAAYLQGKFPKLEQIFAGLVA